MQRHPVKSSQLKSVGYDPETQTLEIEFNSGGIYRYANVTPEMHKGLMEGDSIGKFFHAFIRSNPEGHPFTKLEAQGDEAKKAEA